MDATTGNLVTRAASMGEDHGQSVATWMDAFASDDAARRCLRLDDDGDPEWDEWWGAPPPLSGEWADGPTPAMVLAMLDMDEDDDAASKALAAYEDAYYSAHHDHIIAAAHRYLGE